MTTQYVFEVDGFHVETSDALVGKFIQHLLDRIMDDRKIIGLILDLHEEKKKSSQ